MRGSLGVRILLLLLGCALIVRADSAAGQDAAPDPGQAAAAAAAGAAQPGGASAPEVEEAIQNVLQLMETETRIATASKVNADYVPGILTVLRGSDLEERGMLTVYEALTLVPGLNISLSGSGEEGVVVRGVGSTYTPSTMKLMLNNVSLNSSLDGKASVIFDIPVEQIDRIEIIRGPGAVLYGEYAYSGVINVITRQSGNRVFGRTGSFNTWAGGASLALERPRQEFHLSLNIVGWNTDGGEVDVESDRLTGSPFEKLSRTPGSTNEARGNVTGILAVGFKDFSLTAQYTNSRYGDYYGFAEILPESEDRKVQGNGDFAVEAGQEYAFSSDFSAQLKLGWSRAERDWEAELLPRQAGSEPVGTLQQPSLLLQDVSYRENRLFGELDLRAHLPHGHALLMGFGAAKTTVLDAMMEMDGQEVAWIEGDGGRRLLDVFIQDEFEVTDLFNLTGGLRYDDYNDVGGRLTPRLSAVYRLRDRHILKAQYAEAFRPPSFLEFEGVGTDSANPDLDPELIRTYEGGYIYKSPTADARVTGFYSELDRLIIIERKESAEISESMRFVNSGGATLRGVEVEMLQRVGRHLTVDGNVSYVKTRNNETGAEIEGSAAWLGNVGLTYQPFRHVSLAVQNRYVGKRHRHENDRRDDLAAYDTVDLVLTIADLPRDGVAVRVGVKNVFDEEVVYPSFSNTYTGDYTRPGRQWWVQVSYSF